MSSYKKIDSNGNIRWYKKGTDILHREDGPAVEWNDGDKEWYYEDKLHKIDGPAVEYNNGDKEWYYHGEWIYCSTQEEFEKIIGISKQQVIQEAPCRQCKRKNDVGVKKCWLCECPNPC